jgi:hypothetical protein
LAAEFEPDREEEAYREKLGSMWPLVMVPMECPMDAAAAEAAAVHRSMGQRLRRTELRQQDPQSEEHQRHIRTLLNTEAYFQRYREELLYRRDNVLDDLRLPTQ